MRGPNVADPRNPETIRKSNSTVALTRQAMHDGSVPRIPHARAAKSGLPYDAATPVADIKVDAPGSLPNSCSEFGLHMDGSEYWKAMEIVSSGHRSSCLPDDVNHFRT